MKSGFTFVELLITMIISLMVFGMLWIIIFSVTNSERKIDRMIDFQNFVTTADIMIFNNISESFFDNPPYATPTTPLPNDKSSQQLVFFTNLSTSTIRLNPPMDWINFRISPTTPASYLSITIIDTKTSLEATLVYAKKD